jgi:hypothetical protein
VNKQARFIVAVAAVFALAAAGGALRPVTDIARAEADHGVTLPPGSRVLSRDSSGLFYIDGHCRTEVEVPASGVAALVAQLRPTPRLGGAEWRYRDADGVTVYACAPAPGEDELFVTVRPPRNGTVRVTLATMRD